MPLLDEQVSIGENDPTRNLIMGAGTPFEVIDFNPWIRTTRTSQQQRPWNHGRWSGAEWLDSTTVTAHVGIDANGPDCDGDYDTWIANRHDLSRAWRPIADDNQQVELRFRYGSTEYLMFGRPRVVSPINDWISWVEPGNALASLVFEALDPFVYSAIEHSTGLIGLPFFSGGLLLPYLVPYLIPAVRIGGEAELCNAGNVDTPLRLRIDGPVSMPRVTLQRNDGINQTLRVDIDLPAGQWIDIDTGTRTAFLNGLTTASIRGQVSVDPDWPMLPPGCSTILFNSSDPEELGTLTVFWRDRWV